MSEANEIKLTITETTTRTMLLPEYFTVAELKQQLKASGYNFDNKCLKVFIRHKGLDWVQEASDNTYIVNSDSVYIHTVDDFNAVQKLKEELEDDIEDSWEDEFILNHISIKIFA